METRVKFTEDVDEKDALFGMINIGGKHTTLTEVLESLTVYQLVKLMERIRIEISARDAKERENREFGKVLDISSRLDEHYMIDFLKKNGCIRSD
ncbi:MAG: hypothetical protein QXU18_08695 [Thermoplasmatales archaeon]